MSNQSGFRHVLTTLWLRLITLSIIAIVFCELLKLARGKAQGWSFYLTSAEVAFEVIVRVVGSALTGVALGTVCTILLAPVLWYFKSPRDRLLDGITKIAVFLVIFCTSKYALEILIKWSYSVSKHSGLYDKLLWAAFYLVFALALFLPRPRRAVVSSLDDYLTDKMTRRTAVATLAGTAALAGTEFVLGKRTVAAVSNLAHPRPKSNFVLVTFDALSAEDMSVYGYRLPTTPNLEAFARKSTVFTRFFSGSTYTTPSVGVILMGVFPSESLVYGLSGQLPADRAEKNLPHEMRQAGYATGAFLTNPWAYYLARSVKAGFDVLPEPQFHPGGFQRLWEVTTPLHQSTGFGSRIDEYFDLEALWNDVGRIPGTRAFRFRPGASFENGRQVLSQLQDGFFLWIHVLPPHAPYLPDSADRGHFMPDAELQAIELEPAFKWYPNYKPGEQPKIDRRRLAYDEYLASADRAFGDFMSDLEKSGKLENTTVIVSADHGESFEGGVYQHQTPYLTRPVIHVPLIIHTPGQQDGRTVAFTADQTSLAPTILELAGVPRPDWMRGQSLVPWLNGAATGKENGLAFTQYLERNSIFKPLRHGAVGVIDGEYEYVYYLDTQKGELRPLAEAHIWNLDRSAEFPDRAKALREAIHSRFPEFVPKSS